ncbi:Disease resistance-like protein DSC1 [Linum perenne]
MDSSSSCSSSSSAPDQHYTREWDYDVFVCFRGKDTRRLFTSHLAGHLRRRSIRPFTDEKFDRTENIDVDLVKVLERSAMSVVIFSESFAESSYCLDEVASIAQRVERFGHRVLPVFYGVEPEEVEDRYASMIDDSELKQSPDEKKKRWMDGLKMVINHAGRTSKEFKDDYEMCNTIVDDVSKALSEMSSCGKKSNDLVGMEARVLKVQQLLAMEDDTLSVIGLWGMGGVGKTTLAKTWYHRLTHPTNRTKHHFVSDISENCKTRSGVENLVQQLYSTLLCENNLSLKDLDLDHTRGRLSRMKSVHARAKTHKMKELDSDESLELFSIHAFRKLCPHNDFTNHSRLAASYCKGNPLALKVLGGALFGKDKEYWKSFFYGLEKNSKPEIHDVLSTSYYTLKEEEQRIFLDVACFLFNTAKTRMIKYLSTSYSSAYSLVENLIDKSLIFPVPSNNKCYEVIVVHDLLKEMAWNIVNNGQNPRSRIKNLEDLSKVFEIGGANKGGEGVESLALDLSKAKKELCLGAKAFAGMNSLRFLGFFYNQEARFGQPKISLKDGRIDTLPNKLIWLEWVGYPLKYLPDKFLPEKLVVIVLRHSRIKRCWERVQPKLMHLIRLDLSHCLNLSAIPNLSGCKKLEILCLKGCKTLVELPSQVQHLEKLVELDLFDCPNLARLPTKLNSKCLNLLRLSKCPKVTNCPEINVPPEGGLETLDLEETPVRVMPSAIHKVKEGGIIRLYGKHITSFPRISKRLKLLRLCHTTIKDMEHVDNDHDRGMPLSRFDRLELHGNSKLASLADNIWDMVKHQLWVHGSPLIECLPPANDRVYSLTMVCVENCGKMKSFVPSPCGKSMQNIRYLRTGIDSLPCTSIDQLENLRVLHLSYCLMLECIPDNIHKLANLYLLNLRGSTRIETLPQLLPPKLDSLSISGCKSLRALPSHAGKLKWWVLRIENCPRLDNELPGQISQDFDSCATVSSRAKGSLLYSGSDLPNWCSNNNISSGSYEMVLLPSNTADLKGIAFGVVFSSNAVEVELKIRCDVVLVDGASTSTSSNVVATFLSHEMWISGGSGTTSSDYVFLWFDKKLLGEPKERDEVEEEEEETWYVKYEGCSVSFRVYTLPEGGRDNANKIKKIKFKRLGISLLN